MAHKRGFGGGGESYVIVFPNDDGGRYRSTPEFSLAVQVSAQ
jgi:hypothetical protein